MEKSSVVIRKAETPDVERLLLFHQGIVDAERALITEIRPAPEEIEYYPISTIVEGAVSEATVILVAEVDGMTIGCGLAQLRQNDSAYTDLYYGYIGMMYVVPDWRGSNKGGVVNLLLTELITWLKSHDMKQIRLKVYSANTGAIKAYARNGFEPFYTEMRYVEGDPS